MRNKGVLINRIQHMLVACVFATGILTISATSPNSENTQGEVFSVGNGPIGIAVMSGNTDTDLIYVTNFLGSNMSIVKVSGVSNATGITDISLVDTISGITGGGPYDIAISPNGDHIYGSQSLIEGAISVVYTPENTIYEISISGITEPFGIEISPDGNSLYVANNHNSTLSVIDISSVSGTNISGATAISSIDIGQGPVMVAVSPGGNFVYTTNFADNSLSIIPTADMLSGITIPVGGNPIGLVTSPDGNFIYVSNFSTNDVSIINAPMMSGTTPDMSGVTEFKRIPVSKGPYGIDVSPDGQYIYVANKEAKQISVIQVSVDSGVTDFANIQNIKLDERPYFLAVSPTGNYIYTTNNYDDSISIVQAPF